MRVIDFITVAPALAWIHAVGWMLGSRARVEVYCFLITPALIWVRVLGVFSGYKVSVKIHDEAGGEEEYYE